MVELDKRVMDVTDVAYDEAERYNVLVVSANAGYKLPKQAAHPLIRGLATRYWVRVTGEDIQVDSVTVECLPGPSTNEIFTPNAFAGSVPIFQKAVIYFGQKSAELGYGPSEDIFFYIEFQGCLFSKLMPKLASFMKTSIHVKTKVYVQSVVKPANAASPD